MKEYYQILVDTLLGTMVEPFKKRQHRQVISKASKFYLFDVGVAGILAKRHVEAEKGEQFGRAFEHFMLMEILAHRSYSELDYKIHFWRTKSGLEVDFILDEGEVALEVKGENHIDNKDLKPMKAFMETFSPDKAFVICNEQTERLAGEITIIPWKQFLTCLWEGKIIS